MKKLFSILFLLCYGGVVMTLPIGSTGTPDYGANLTSNPTAPAYEEGEGINRLLMGGGANSRSGRVLWATGFESSMAEVIDIANVGAVAALDDVIAYQGAKSLKMQTTGALNDAVRVYKVLYSPFAPLADAKRIGQESMFAPFLAAPNGFEFAWWIVFPISPTRSYEFRVIFVTNGTTGDLYTENNGVRTLIGNINAYMSIAAEQFHYTKLVVDGKNGTYTRFTFDDLSFDLSARPGYQALLPTNGMGIEFDLRIQTTSAWPNVARVDNWILTSDEP